MSNLIYLDNASTSHPKPESVYRSMDEVVRLSANPGRGGHRQTLKLDRLVFETREAVADLFGVRDSSRIVFTANATMAINIALFGLLTAGDRVVTSSMEHNAVTRPLRALQERGVQVVKVGADRSGYVDLDALRRACLAAPTRMVVLNHCSNVTGTLQPIEELGLWCRQHNLLFMVDGSQSAGSFPLNLDALAIDLFAAPGHKGLLGPQGTGFLYLRQGVQPAPLLYGGTGGNSHADMMPEQLPERLESGTMNTPGLAGLKAGVEFIREIGQDRICLREQQLVNRLLNGLRALPGIEVYGPVGADRHGAAVSFNMAGLDPAEVGFRLDHEFSISVRVGLHCAPDAHRTIGTYPRGTVRVSPSYLTGEDEIDRLLLALDKIRTQPAV
jgi:cysteine desulfurase family protein